MLIKQLRILNIIKLLFLLMKLDLIYKINPKKGGLKKVYLIKQKKFKLSQKILL